MSVDNLKQLNLDPSVPTVFVTGVTGQDGSHMVDYLLSHYSYNVVGGTRRLSVPNHGNLKHLEKNPRFHTVHFDLLDTHSIDRLVDVLQPNYFINFAAQSHVKASWEYPVQTSDANTKGVIHILKSLQEHCPSCHFYNAGSSEEFGDVVYSPQDEQHPMRPRSPYGASKSSARQWVKVYRESYNMFAIQGWLFNHEGIRRGEDFVTRKVTKKVAQIVQCIEDRKPFTPLELGNLDAMRDWSDAEDCMEAVWMMLNSREPKEYVVASGEQHSIRELVEVAFATMDIKGHWEGERANEKFIQDTLSFPDDVLVKINPAFYRPAEVETLCGNSALIRKELGWKPKTSFRQLIRKMVEHDYNTTEI